MIMAAKHGFTCSYILHRKLGTVNDGKTVHWLARTTVHIKIQAFCTSSYESLYCIGDESECKYLWNIHMKVPGNCRMCHISFWTSLPSINISFISSSSCVHLNLQCYWLAWFKSSPKWIRVMLNTNTVHHMKYWNEKIAICREEMSVTWVVRFPFLSWNPHVY
jgi:hypothetical protein